MTRLTYPWRIVLLLAAALLPVLTVPRIYCGWHANALFDGEPAIQSGFGVAAANAVQSHSDLLFYHTGSERFDGQSAIAVYQMTLLGLGQIVTLHPEFRERYLPAMRLCAKRLVDRRTLLYAEHVYGQHGAHISGRFNGHAYLGYINLALGMLRMVEPNTEFAALHDRISVEFARQLDASPNGLIETYPGETWPPDVAAVVGSVGLHAKATGIDRSKMLARWEKRFADCAVSPSGYLIQRVASGTCKALDAPRGSGTAVAAYFLSFATPNLALRLHESLTTVGHRSLLGFGTIREYAPGASGFGDGNSGPVIFGVSVGATGFAIASARIHSDRELFRELVSTATLFGVPTSKGEGTTFASGGVLGNALLLAMLTANPT